MVSIFSTELGDVELTLVGGTIGYKACVRLTYWDGVLLCRVSK